MDKVRVLRIIEYVGDRNWVEATLKRSINGIMKVGDNEIRSCIINQFPDILENLPIVIPEENDNPYDPFRDIDKNE